jgi:ABC-type multidrug transport system ATPase subunit
VTSFFSLTSINKSFAGNQVLRDLSVSFNLGERVLVLGANGAGKSTFLRVCAGLARPERGSVTASGGRVLPRSLGYFGHLPLLYAELSVRENLELAQKLAGVEEHTEELLEEWGIKSHAEVRLSNLSKGLQARASLARAFLHQPKFLFLDEPTSALDEASVAILKNAIAKNDARHQGGALTCIVTHDVARLRDFATRVLVLKNGIVFADTGTSALSHSHVINDYLSSNR